MTQLFDFLDLIDNEVHTLLAITPWYIQSIFYVACLICLILSIKRIAF